MNDIPAENVLAEGTETNKDAALIERKRGRSPICSRLELIPMDSEGKLLHSETLEVVGKDLSTAGLAFSHMRPLPSQRAAIAFTHPKTGYLAVEVKVLYSELTATGLYESGCRLVRKLSAAESQVQQ